MTHGGRTPEGEVLVTASSLDDSDARVDNRGFAETVRVSGEPRVGILNDVLESANIEAACLDLESIELGLRTLVQVVTDLLSVSTQGRGVELACRLPIGVPATLLRDVDRLRRVLTELVAALLLTDDDALVVALHKSIGRDDAPAAVRSAHTLSGASSNLGATALARPCATLAAESAVGALVDGETLLGPLEDELSRVRCALQSAALAPC